MRSGKQIRLKAEPEKPESATIAFEVPGNPQPKQRPRVVTSCSGRSVAYTPRRTRFWELSVAHEARQCLPEPLEGPLSVSLAFFRGDKRRCDLDNLAKAVLDGLNGIAYHDDAQIVELNLRREFDRERPRVEIEIRPVEQEDRT